MSGKSMREHFKFAPISVDDARESLWKSAVRGSDGIQPWKDEYMEEIIIV